MIRNLSALIGFIFSSTMTLAEIAPPKIYVDKGACPYECCTYRSWNVKINTDLVDGIDGKKKLGTALKGTKVTALTGEVHTIPLKIKNRDGKEIYLLTYEGEGYWTTWQDGAAKTNVEQNWSDARTPQNTWWIQIKLADGTTGWTKERSHFEDLVGCGSEGDGVPETEEKPVVAATPTLPESGLTCNLGVTGIEDKAAFIKYFSDLKTAVAGKDQEALSKLVVYPLKVNREPKRFVVKNATEFKKEFKSIFTKNVSDAIVNQDISNLFCRDQGVMFGSGQAWVTERNKQIGIYSINP